ncbi:MAG: inner nuclear membrane protein enriched at telomere/subtelomere region [Piccolia ochrophora]|nr:MAG: inner nuclear membrane protein enriched at telomere/subtelomere region [Piccolia ochrophora]
MATPPDNDLDYLSPDFNPASLTVPRIRSILVAHGVDYPSSAKKPQLVEIFSNTVVPQARKILSARSRIKRTSKGITDVDSSREGTLVGDDDVGPMPPPRRKPGRKPGKASTTDGSDDGLQTMTPAKTPAKRSARASETSETDLGTEALPKRSTARKSRKSEAPPVVKVEEPDGYGGQTGDDSVFSDDNPFQSGSSPLTGPSRVASGDGRRKSAQPSSGKDAQRRKSSANRRKTEGHAPTRTAGEGTKLSPTSSRKFEIPVNRLRKSHEDIAEDGVETGEEFTPEEQLELTREQLKDGVTDNQLTRPKPKQRGRGRVGRSISVVLLTLLCGYGAWWRREKLEVGYCGVGRAPSTVMNAQIPEWASILQPDCEPCPQHAYCYAHLETSCEQDFVLKPHPLSIGGAVPLPPTCEPDGEKVRRVKAVADRAVEVLRDQRAKFECGEVDEKGAKAASPQIDEAVLKKEVGKKRKKGMSEVEFEELWNGALGEIVGREEVASGSDGPHHQLLSSTSLAQLPLGCTLRRSLRLTLAEHRIALSLVTLTLLSLLYLRSHLRALSTRRARVPALVHLTLTRLAAHATHHARDRHAAPDPAVPISQLRDDVLREEFDPRERERVWKRVREVVEMNANVRASVRELRGGSGEVGRVWEWIGSVGGALTDDENGRGGRRRESWAWSGVPVDDDEDHKVDHADEDAARSASPRREMVQKRYEDSRPIY